MRPDPAPAGVGAGAEMPRASREDHVGLEGQGGAEARQRVERPPGLTEDNWARAARLAGDEGISLGSAGMESTPVGGVADSLAEEDGHV